MITFLLPSLFLACCYILFLIFSKKYKKFSMMQLVFITAFYVYIISIIGIVFFPFPVQKELIADSIQQGFSNVNNFIPFQTIMTGFNGYFEVGFAALKHIVFNVVMFMPFGGSLPILYKKKINFGTIVKYSLLFSISIESIQYLLSLMLGFTYRSTDVDDLILNVFGAIIGYSVYCLLKNSIQRIEREIKYIRPL